MVCVGVGGCLWVVGAGRVECGCGGVKEVEELSVASSFGSLRVRDNRKRLPATFCARARPRDVLGVVLK
jgi:hypothetical protein